MYFLLQERLRNVVVASPQNALVPERPPEFLVRRAPGNGKDDVAPPRIDGVHQLSGKALALAALRDLHAARLERQAARIVAETPRQVLVVQVSLLAHVRLRRTLTRQVDESLV